jgi:hypothetical protein
MVNLFSLFWFEFLLNRSLVFNNIFSFLTIIIYFIFSLFENSFFFLKSNNSNDDKIKDIEVKPKDDQSHVSNLIKDMDDMNLNKQSSLKRKLLILYAGETGKVNLVIIVNNY